MKHQKIRIAILVLSFLLVSPNLLIPINGKTEANTESNLDSEQTPCETVNPSASPSGSPIPTATPFVGEEYQLKNPKVKYKKGGQKGIHVGKVKEGKVYQLVSYTTDTISLTMSHPSTFRICGGSSKKAMKKIVVTSLGKVFCKRQKKGKEEYALVEAVSQLTGGTRYIYIRFREKLSGKQGTKISLQEKKSKVLKFNYSKKKLSFTIKNKKVATINKKGKLIGKKPGKTTLTVKVKDSKKNNIKLRIVIKEEPWIVSEKDTKYDYQDMKTDLYQLQKKYPSRMAVFSLGKSYDKRGIWCIRIGNPRAKKELVVDAAIHGREWLNTQILMRQGEEILREYGENKSRFQNTCLYLIPMANPDGVSISQYGFSSIQNKMLRKRCEKIGHAKRWKCNARGVNLNGNFPVGFSKKKKPKKPDYQFYPGKKAKSEKETRILIRFFDKINPDAVINLHSTGSILYWDFNVSESLNQRVKYLATKISSYNGYRLMPKSAATKKTGGLADWLVYKKGIPSVTIETGSVACPLPHAQYQTIWKKNNKVFRWFFLRY